MIHHRQIKTKMAASMANRATSVNLDNVDKLTSLEDIQKALEIINDKENVLNGEIDDIVNHQSRLDSKMGNIHKTIPNLQLLHTDSNQLSSMISFTSTLAENVSRKVRQLDLAKSRVTASMQMVEDILDLKFCTDGVQMALQNEDYEQAAAHVHRFLSMDENILRVTSDTADSGSLDTSFKLLHEADEKLKTLVTERFDSAVEERDIASTERFFKIFPLLKLHDDGLRKFSQHLATQIAETAQRTLQTALAAAPSDKRANVVFADAITMLFEGIARTVETHQPLVETYYGPGRMLFFMKNIQDECDRQTQAIVKEFKTKREFSRKFQLLEQSLMSRMTPSAESDRLLDTKELDVLLGEVTLLNTRAELYLRFIRRRVTTDLEAASQTKEASKEQLVQIETFLSNCELSKIMQELIGQYIMMEEYFMSEMVTKAITMDTSDGSALISSMVDDTFFIVKKCVRRSMSSSSVDGVCAMINNACTMLDEKYREELFNRMRSGFPSGFDFQAAYNIVQGKSSDTEKAKTAFLMSLNNAEVSGEYVQTLKKNLEGEVLKLFGQEADRGKAKLETCLTDLGALSSRFKDVVEFGFSQLLSSVIKPRIKPLVESFATPSHNITEEQYTDYEANDPWVQNFIVHVDTFLKTFKTCLTNSIYDKFVAQLCNEVTGNLEKAVMKKTFNRLGGLQFDKELRSLINYLTSVTTWTVRDKFARLIQKATILNLEKVGEILDYWGPNSGPMTWRLTPTEVRQVLALRIDFKNEDIKRLKL